MKINDLDFARKVRGAFDEQLDSLPASSAHRLAEARRVALARRKVASAQVPAMASAASPVPSRVRRTAAAPFEWIGALLAGAPEWMGRAAVAAPLLAIAIGLTSVAEYQHERHLQEVAELDAAVLADELPLTAYLDHGFNAYLSQPAQAQ